MNILLYRMFRCKRLLYALVVTMCSQNVVVAQVYVNNALLTIEENAFAFVGGDLDFDGAVNINNQGVLALTGDISNNSVSDGHVFDSSAGKVCFWGGEQSVKGVGSVFFSSVEFTGHTRKELLVDVFVNKRLNLNGCELAVISSKAGLNSADTSALAFEEGVGYITTERGDSWFFRAMNAGNTYVYPFGRYAFGSWLDYKPMIFTPDTYGKVYGQLQSHDPGYDGYSTANLSQKVGSVNREYYYRISAVDTGVLSTSVGCLFDSIRYKGFDIITNWDSAMAKWVNLQSGTPLSSNMSGFKSVNARSLRIDPHSNMVIGLGVLAARKTFDMSLPNAFTPNGDGENDYLVFPDLYKYPENKLLVFNRNGNNVYEKVGYDNRWDGSNLAEGTYFYILSVKDNDGQWHDLKNFLMIVR